jgi:aminopeptidase N
VCEPITMGIVAGVTAIGTGMQIASGVASADYQAEVAQNNALLARWQAEDAQIAGGEAASAYRAAGAKAASSAVAQLAASGVDTTVGSAANIPTQSIVNAEMDAVTAKANAARAAWGFQEEATNRLAQAEANRHSAILGGVGMGIGGFGQTLLYGYNAFSGGGWSSGGWSSANNTSSFMTRSMSLRPKIGW